MQAPMFVMISPLSDFVILSKSLLSVSSWDDRVAHLWWVVAVVAHSAIYPDARDNLLINCRYVHCSSVHETGERIHAPISSLFNLLVLSVANGHRSESLWWYIVRRRINLSWRLVCSTVVSEVENVISKQLPCRITWSRYTIALSNNCCFYFVASS